ncbi:MAG: CvpA family protein [Gammaproteobacteria bacterium]
MPANLAIVDYIILAIVGLSVVLGVWRGFMREVIALVAWVAAFLIAFIFVDVAAAALTPYVSVPSVRVILAFGGLFLITLFIGGLVNIIVAQLVKHTGLSGTDRLLGMVFGAGRGIALVALLLLLLGSTPLPKEPWWQSSVLLPYIQPLAMILRNRLPTDLSQYFNFGGLLGAGILPDRPLPANPLPPPAPAVPPPPPAQH